MILLHSSFKGLLYFDKSHEHVRIENAILLQVDFVDDSDSGGSDTISIQVNHFKDVC